MAGNRQYPKAEDISTIQRLKYVSTFVVRGYSARKIAELLDYDPRRAGRDILAVRNRTTEIADLDSHLRDISERTKEQLQQIGEKKSILWDQVNWAKEWVEKRGPDGVILLDSNDDPVMGPREPHLLVTYMGQLNAVMKEEQQLLGLLDKTVDVTVRLEQSIRVQTMLIDTIREVGDPTTYAEIRRRIAAIAATPGSGQENQTALPGANDDIIEGEVIVR